MQVASRKRVVKGGLFHHAHPSVYPCPATPAWRCCLDHSNGGGGGWVLHPSMWRTHPHPTPIHTIHPLLRNPLLSTTITRDVLACIASSSFVGPSLGLGAGLERMGGGGGSSTGNGFGSGCDKLKGSGTVLRLLTPVALTWLLGPASASSLWVVRVWEKVSEEKCVKV